jgi:capsular polysaccharide biosynthesis protein
MDMTPDRPHGSTSLPAWPAAASPPSLSAAPQAWDEFPDPEAAPPRAFTVKALVRAMRRHWWQILLIWVVLTGGLLTAVTKYVKPSYEAAAILQVEPTSSSVLTTNRSTNTDLDSFMVTQTQLLTSSDVVAMALKEPKVAALPRVRMSVDPESDLKKQLRVSIPPKSHVIVVSLSTESPTDGALIVNAVVDAYTELSASLVDSTTRKLIAQYKEAKQKFQGDVDRLRDEMTALTAITGNADPKSNPAMVALEDYNRYRARLSQVEMERIEAEVALRVLNDAMRGMDPGTDADAAAPPSPEELEQAAEQIMKNDQEYRQLSSAFQEAKSAYDHASGSSGTGTATRP